MNRVRIVAPALVCALVAAVWLNQSVGLRDWETLRERTFSAPSAHTLDYLRYPFIFLYRRSHDDDLYYATASAILGAPYDAEALERGGVPARFEHIEVAADGRWHTPYVEVPFEYPPVALPFVLAPRLVASTRLGYERVFSALMAACLVAACAIAIRIARRVERDARHDGQRWWIATGLLLAHGAIAVQRLDATVALFIALALDAAVQKKPALLGVWTGVATAAKLVPALLLPVIVAADRQWLGRLRAFFVVAGAATVALLVALVVPFALLPGSVDVFLGYHQDRGLQAESTFGIVYGVAHAITSGPAVLAHSFGSFNFEGAVPDRLARAAAPVSVAAIAALAAWIARLPPPADEAARVERLALAAVAGTTLVWLSGKVFSPQYMTWGIPLVLAVPGAARARVTVLLFAALLSSQIYLRGYYDFVVEQRAAGLATVAVRQAVLIALVIAAVRAMAPRAKLGG